MARRETEPAVAGRGEGDRPAHGKGTAPLRAGSTKRSPWVTYRQRRQMEERRSAARHARFYTRAANASRRSRRQRRRDQSNDAFRCDTRRRRSYRQASLARVTWFRQMRRSAPPRRDEPTFRRGPQSRGAHAGQTAHGGQLQFALADTNEKERTSIASCFSVQFELDGEGTDDAEQSQPCDDCR